MLDPVVPSGIVEVRALFTGRVQGVGFRFKAKSHADRLGILGTVGNLDDGSVEIYAQGDTGQVVALVEALKAESGPIKVKSIETAEIFPHRIYSGFRII